MKHILANLIVLIGVTSRLFAQPFSIPATTDHAGGEYQIYRSEFQSTITISNVQQPIIWVEGFDALNKLDIEDNYRTIDDGNLAFNLHLLGYDIVVLNFNEGGDEIGRNAMVLVELINQINAGKPNPDELVVMGFSMGGLVSRYALAYMEENGMDHETRLYVSYDSPHKGAHVPVSIQSFALTFNDNFFLNHFSDELEDLITTFNAPAALQMLKYRVSSGNDPAGQVDLSQSHVDFLDDINNLNSCNGFPKNSRNIAISLGSWSGVAQRASIDSDGNGQNDFQHAGFPLAFINFPSGDHTGPTNVWQLNGCQTVAAFSLQSFISTAVSYNYPYLSDRHDYLNLEDYFYATYWYRNSMGSSVLPAGAWSNFYSYENFEDTDFAPGGYSNAYEQLIVGLNSAINCSFSYYDNSTFIPTVSALAFDSHDLFYNIRDDPNRLDRTPFDEIFGLDENTSHNHNPAINTSVVAWLVDQIDGNHPSACVDDLVQVGYFGGGSNIEVVSSGETVTISDAEDIESRSYQINSGATVTFIADNSIVLLPGFHAKDGSNFSASLAPCSGKACAWTPYYTNPSQALQFQVDKISNPTCANPCVQLVVRAIGPNGNYVYHWYQDDDRIGCDPPTACSSTTDLGEGKYINVCYDNNQDPNEVRDFRIEITELHPGGSSTSHGEIIINGDANCGGARTAVETEEEVSENLEAIAENNSENHVYPNPSEGKYTLQTRANVQRIIIRDLSGRIIKTTDPNTRNQTIDLRNYRNGIYILELHESSGKKEFIRIIKK